MTTTLSLPDVAAYVCQRGLRVRANQVFDVEASGDGLTPAAVTTLLDELGTRNP